MKMRRGFMNSGGVMKKRKVLRFLLLCLGIVGSASAVEVINIDINNYGNESAYDGQGAAGVGALDRLLRRLGSPSRLPAIRRSG